MVRPKMKRKTLTMRLDDLTDSKLNEISNALGLTRTRVVEDAIDELYRIYVYVQKKNENVLTDEHN